MADKILFELILLMMWACLEVPTWKNQLFTDILSTKAVLENFYSSMGISFAPGLHDILTGNNPPDIEYFMHLPRDSLNKWAVYALVFKKPGSPDLLYIGSGTSCLRGCITRWQQYDNYIYKNGSIISNPWNIIDAVKDGYELCSKGMLAHCPLPSAADTPRFRLVMVLLEATLSFAFWSMSSRKPTHKMASCRLWPLEAFTYDGLCSHSPLQEGVLRDFDLTDEQLEIQRLNIQEKNSQYHKDNYKRRKVEEPEKLAAERKRAAATQRAKPLDVREARGRRFTKKHKESGRFRCDICGTTFAKSTEQTRHNRSRRHEKKVKALKAGIVDQFHCTICNFSTSTAKLLRHHNRGNRHLARAAASQN